MRRTFRTILASAVMAGAAACGGGTDDAANIDTGMGTMAQQPATGAVPPGGQMSGQDMFGAMAAANAAEIEAGQLAADSATNGQVKEYGRMMVTDHKAMNEELHQAAQQAGLQSRAGETTENLVGTIRDIAGELRGKRGAEFDRAFMDAMVRSHEETLALLDRATQAQSLPQQLTGVVTSARQKVQQHLEQARQIQGRVRGS